MDEENIVGFNPTFQAVNRENLEQVLDRKLMGVKCFQNPETEENSIVIITEEGHCLLIRLPQGHYGTMQYFKGE